MLRDETRSAAKRVPNSRRIAGVRRFAGGVGILIGYYRRMRESTSGRWGTTRRCLACAPPSAAACGRLRQWLPSALPHPCRHSVVRPGRPPRSKHSASTFQADSGTPWHAFAGCQIQTHRWTRWGGQRACARWMAGCRRVRAPGPHRGACPTGRPSASSLSACIVGDDVRTPR